MVKKNASIHQVILTFSHSDVHQNFSGYKFSGVVDPVTGKKDIICKNKKENCGAAQCQCDRQLAFQLAEAEITWNPNNQGLYFFKKKRYGPYHMAHHMGLNS